MNNIKKVLILGASSDIGTSTTKTFLDAGWEVTGHFNNNSKSLEKLKYNNNKLKTFKFNLKNINSFENYVLKKKSFFKSFDAFVNLTGYLKPTSFENFKIKDLNEHLNVNYFSSLLIIREVLKGMERRKWGRIVLSGSIGTKFGGGENTLAYSLSKFNNQFFPSFYKKMYSKNITINTLQIGPAKTKLHKKLKNKNIKKRIKLIPLKRMASSIELANYIYYLCSKKNSLLMGSVINVSGGE
jgi:3-oxoacyl-[acyl-carrier protein] reductase